ncbi:MAG: LCP family protein [Stackebrandtia sp.]
MAKQGDRRAGDIGASKPRSPLWAKLFVGFGSVLLVVSGGTFAYAASLFGTVNDIPQADFDVEARDNVEGAQNLLLVGADLRSGAEGEARADTIMIMHINEDHDSANIVSIPRDLRAEIPDCGNGQPCTEKINHSYAYGGPDPADAANNLMEAVTAETGVEFDGVALVDFEGFLEVVETFGGIDLCLSQELYSKNGDKTFPKGCDRYEPHDALLIVRERYDWNDGDYGRQRMQQHFIKQLLKEADKQGYVKNPAKVGPLIEQIGSHMLINLGIEPVDFAFAMTDVKAGAMENIQLPSEPSETGEFGDGLDYVVIRDGEQRTAADALYTALQEDTLDEWLAQYPDYLNDDAGDK